MAPATTSRASRSKAANTPSQLEDDLEDVAVIALKRDLRARGTASTIGSRACDNCRRSKLKCVDTEEASPSSSDDPTSARVCKRCKTNGLECTRNDVLLKRGRPSTSELEVFKSANVPYKTFRNRMKERRERAQMTQRELDERQGRIKGNRIKGNRIKGNTLSQAPEQTNASSSGDSVFSSPSFSLSPSVLNAQAGGSPSNFSLGQNYRETGHSDSLSSSQVQQFNAASQEPFSPSSWVSSVAFLTYDAPATFLAPFESTTGLPGLGAATQPPVSSAPPPISQPNARLNLPSFGRQNKQPSASGNHMAQSGLAQPSGTQLPPVKQQQHQDFTVAEFQPELDFSGLTAAPGSFPPQAFDPLSSVQDQDDHFAQDLRNSLMPQPPPAPTVPASSQWQQPSALEHGLPQAVKAATSPDSQLAYESPNAPSDVPSATSGGGVSSSSNKAPPQTSGRKTITNQLALRVADAVRKKTLCIRRDAQMEELFSDEKWQIVEFSTKAPALPVGSSVEQRAWEVDDLEGGGALYLDEDGVLQLYPIATQGPSTPFNLLAQDWVTLDSHGEAISPPWAFLEIAQGYLDASVAARQHAASTSPGTGTAESSAAGASENPAGAMEELKSNLHFWPPKSYSEEDFDVLRAKASKVLMHPLIPTLLKRYFAILHNWVPFVYSSQIIEYFRELLNYAHTGETSYTKLQLRQRQSFILMLCGAEMLHNTGCHLSLSGESKPPPIDANTKAGLRRGSAQSAEDEYEDEMIAADTAYFSPWEFQMGMLKLGWALLQPAQDGKFSGEETTMDLLLSARALYMPLTGHRLMGVASMSAMAQIEGNQPAMNVGRLSLDSTSKELLKRQFADSVDFTVHCKLWKDRHFDMNGVSNRLAMFAGDIEAHELPGEIYGSSPTGTLFRSCWNIWKHQGELNLILIRMLDSSLLTPFSAATQEASETFVGISPEEATRRAAIQLASKRETEAEEIYEDLQRWARSALSREDETDANAEYNPGPVEVAARSRLRFFVVNRYKLALQIMSRSLQEVDVFWALTGVDPKRARRGSFGGGAPVPNASNAAALLSAAAATVGVPDEDQPDPDDYVLDWVHNPRW